MTHDKRKTPRMLVRVLVDFESPDTYLYDYSNDLSEGGIFIETDNPFSMGTPVTLRFTLPGVDRVFEAKGKVVWINAPDENGKLPAPHLSKGMGVQFSEIDETDRTHIRTYVEKTKGPNV